MMLDETVADLPVLCLRCGYDLRGRPDEAACPECGLGVGRSVQGQRELHRGRPAWIGRLRAGAWVLLGLQGGLLVAAFGGMYGLLTWVTPAAALGLAGVVLAAHAAALWLLTSRENRFERRQPGNGVRQAVRWAVADDLWMAACVAELATAGPGTSAAFWAGGLAAGAGLLAVSWALTFVHLRRLAKRVLDRSLAEHCLIVGIGLPVAVATPFLVVWSGASLAEGPGGLLMSLAVLVGLFLFVLWSALLLAWFGVAFGRAAATARATWAAADAAA